MAAIVKAWFGSGMNLGSLRGFDYKTGKVFFFFPSFFGFWRIWMCILSAGNC